MNGRWVWLLVSLGAFIAGLGLLLGFIHRFTVPHVLTSDFAPTQCVITTLYVECPHSTRTLLPINSEKENSLSKEVGTKYDHSFLSTSHSHNMVSCDLSQGQKGHVGLHQTAKRAENDVPDVEFHNEANPCQKLPKNQSRASMTSQTTVLSDQGRYMVETHPLCGEGTSDQVTCSNLEVRFHDYRGRPVQAQQVFSDSWTYYQVSTGNTKCSCPSCQVSVVKVTTSESPDDHVILHQISLGDHMYQAKDHVDCWYNRYNVTEVLLWKPSTMLVMNVMLWPTILFILGFVGVFFSCLFVQQDDCHWRRHCCTCDI